jgi:hypothetical protein
MKSNAIKIGFLTIGVVFLAGTLARAEGPTRGRTFNQQREIYSGVRSGDITPHEYGRLTREQNRIRDYRQRAFSDGRLNRFEAGRLNRMQNRAGRHIYQSQNNIRRDDRFHRGAHHDRGRLHGSTHRWPHYYGRGPADGFHRFQAPSWGHRFSSGGLGWGRH